MRLDGLREDRLPNDTSGLQERTHGKRDLRRSLQEHVVVTVVQLDDRVLRKLRELRAGVRHDGGNEPQQ
jgi:hypothetical protein